MITLRPISLDDAETIVRWRNTQEARDIFFTKEVVTPDTHIRFIENKKPHDLVWMILWEFGPLGMVSLTVNTVEHTAEFGRFYIDPKFRLQGIGLQAAKLVVDYAFNILRLKSIWLATPYKNGTAYNLYSKLGFVFISEFERGIYMELKNGL